jgi:hypothetical protein
LLKSVGDRVNALSARSESLTSGAIPAAGKPAFDIAEEVGGDPAFAGPILPLAEIPSKSFDGQSFNSIRADRLGSCPYGERML